jgi:hypothetical protein
MSEKAESAPNYLRVSKLIVMFYVISSSLLFACFFELERYQIILGPRNLSLMDKCLVVLLLTGKSVALFVPLFPILSWLISRDKKRSAALLLNACWIGAFYIMACDLMSVGFAGYHIWDYSPYFMDIIRNPADRIWQWAGERFLIEAVVLLLIMAIVGPVWFWLLGRLTRWAEPRTQRFFLISRAMTTTFLLMPIGIIPAVNYNSDKVALERLLAALPVTQDVLAFFDFNSANKRTEAFPISENLDSAINKIHSFREAMGAKKNKKSDSQGKANENLTARKMLDDAVTPPAVDKDAYVTRGRLPNVVMVIFESFRSSALTPDFMSKLYKWSENGLRMDRHFSGSNCSHLGLYSLFYARCPLGYHQTLDEKIPPQMLESLKRSGYEITFLTSGEVKGFRRVQDFLNDKTCDSVTTVGDPLSGSEDWPESDRKKLALTGKMLNTADKPQFIFYYLLSSHYPYVFPPEFEQYQEPPGFFHFIDAKTRIRHHLSRYKTALEFLEHELMKLLDSIDPKRNIVIVTGDHAESMGEDGVFTHGSRMSEIQMRVPCAMVGPGIKSKVISSATVHMDILPTLLHALAGEAIPVAGTHGRDLLSDARLEDMVPLAPAGGQNWEGVIVIDGKRRAAYRSVTNPKSVPDINFAGLIDEGGHFESRNIVNESAILKSGSPSNSAPTQVR